MNLYDMLLYKKMFGGGGSTPTPSGTLSISSNGTYNVASYASADVNVSGGGADTLAVYCEGGNISTNATFVSAGAFISCSYVTSANLPSASYIGSSAFKGCSILYEISMPECTQIYQNAFEMCNRMSSINAPNLAKIGAAAFSGCASLTAADFPNVTSAGPSAFYSCVRLTTASLPKLTKVDTATFSNCIRLETVYLPIASSINNLAFQKCYNLLSVYLLSTTTVWISGSSVFASTPIGGYTTSTSGIYGSVYVPESLYSAYLSSTYWSNFFSERLVSLTDAQIAALGF